MAWNTTERKGVSTFVQVLPGNLHTGLAIVLLAARLSGITNLEEFNRALDDSLVSGVTLSILAGLTSGLAVWLGVSLEGALTEIDAGIAGILLKD